MAFHVWKKALGCTTFQPHWKAFFNPKAPLLAQKNDALRLSERLANAGVLPMFGFPTRVRSLYGRRPRDQRDEERAEVTGRPLDIAVSSFSPGAEILRDKEIHVCHGFGAWRFENNKAVPIDPLGDAIIISRCPECDATVPADSTEPRECSVCQTQMNVFKMFQPLGFRTTYQPRDYDDQAERGPLLSPPQLSFVSDEPSAYELGALSVVVREAADVVTVNDNDERLFEMYKVNDGTLAVPNTGLYSARTRLGTPTRPPDKVGAIGSVKTTDVLILELSSDKLPGPDAVIETRPKLLPCGLSALWSFAELLRVAAAIELDIGPDEIHTGLQPRRVGDSVSRRVFLADTLENGAGYATHLGKKAELEELFQRILGDRRARLERSPHDEACDSSCPDCLRSYNNRRLHSMLNWRLALDVAELAAGEDLRVSRWLDGAQTFATQFRDAFRELDGIEVVKLGALQGISLAGRVVVLGHPFWRAEERYWVPEQLEAVYVARTKFSSSEIRCVDLFTAHREPDQVFAWLAEALI